MSFFSSQVASTERFVVGGVLRLHAGYPNQEDHKIQSMTGAGVTLCCIQLAPPKLPVLYFCACLFAPPPPSPLPALPLLHANIPLTTIRPWHIGGAGPPKRSPVSQRHAARDAGDPAAHSGRGVPLLACTVRNFSVCAKSVCAVNPRI